MAGLVDFKNEEEVKEYLQNTEIEFMFGCEKEHDSDSCARHANFLESIRKDFKRAAQVYESCCETYRNPVCCFQAGQYHMVGRGGLEKNYVTAFNQYRTACIQTKTTIEGKNDRIAAACCNMGLLLTRQPHEQQEKFWEAAKAKVDYSKADSKIELDEKSSPKNGLEAFQRSCSMNDAIGCNFLSQLYMGGFEAMCTPNWKLAAQYAEKSCELGNPHACHNLAIMHQRGDGVAKDEKKADEYKARKQELLEGGVSLQFGQ